MDNLNLPILFLATITCAIAGALLSRRLVAKHQIRKPETMLQKVRVIYIVVFLPLIVIPANYIVFTHPTIQWQFPAWLQISYQTIAWGISISAMAMVFGFCSATYFITNHTFRWPIALASVVGLGAILFFCWTRSVVEPPLLTDKPVIKDGVTLQSSSSTCVPAACVNVLKVLGINMTEKALVRSFGTSTDGTLPAQAMYGMQRLGVKITKRSVKDCDIQAIKPPAILFVSLDTHAVSFIGMTNGLAEIWDPGSGKKFMKPESIKNIWQGHALECTRD